MKRGQEPSSARPKLFDDLDYNDSILRMSLWNSSRNGNIDLTQDCQSIFPDQIAAFARYTAVDTSCLSSLHARFVSFESILYSISIKGTRAIDPHLITKSVIRLFSDGNVVFSWYTVSIIVWISPTVIEPNGGCRVCFLLNTATSSGEMSECCIALIVRSRHSDILFKRGDLVVVGNCGVLPQSISSVPLCWLSCGIRPFAIYLSSFDNIRCIGSFNITFCHGHGEGICSVPSIKYFACLL